MQVQELSGYKVAEQCRAVSWMSEVTELGIWNCWIATQSSEY